MVTPLLYTVDYSSDTAMSQSITAIADAVRVHIYVVVFPSQILTFLPLVLHFSHAEKRTNWPTSFVPSLLSLGLHKRATWLTLDSVNKGSVFGSLLSPRTPHQLTVFFYLP